LEVWVVWSPLRRPMCGGFRWCVAGVGGLCMGFAGRRLV
jgi:hypothetical protein